MEVLLIDDNPQVAKDLGFLLPASIKIRWASGSEQAMFILRQESPPEAIILDLCLPPFLAQREEDEGLELLSRLREELAADTPVLILSNVPRVEAENVCLSRGACAYLEKPCAVDELVHLLKEATDAGL